MIALKKPEMILAISNAFLKYRYGMVQGVFGVNIHEFAAEGGRHLMMGCRELLESNVDYRQILPYLMLYKKNAEGKIAFFVYRRCKGIGEERLLGKASVGIGGHIDGKDVVFSEGSEVVFDQTISKNALREASEEVTFFDGDGNHLANLDINIGCNGVICDSQDAVGLVHLGILLSAEVPADVEIKCREAELEAIGFMTIDEILEAGMESDLENWSAMALGYMRAIEMHELEQRLAEEAAAEAAKEVAGA